MKHAHRTALDAHLPRGWLLRLCLILVVAVLAPTAALTAQGGPARPETPAAQPGGLLFIENAGQFDPAARFQVWGGPSTVWLAEDAIWLTVVEPEDRGQASGDRDQGSGVREQGAGRLSVAPDERNAPAVSVVRKAVNIHLSFPGANPQPVIEPTSSAPQAQISPHAWG